jgi:hypothetical protein
MPHDRNQFIDAKVEVTDIKVEEVTGMKVEGVTDVQEEEDPLLITFPAMKAEQHVSSVFVCPLLSMFHKYFNAILSVLLTGSLYKPQINQFRKYTE